jgi:hypothetical protein
MKALAVIVGGILLGLVILGVANVFRDWRISALVAAVAAAGIWGLYLLDRRREQNAAKLSAEQAEARFGELSALANAGHFELKVKGSKQALYTFAFLVVGAVVMYWGWTTDSVGAMVGGAIIFLLGAFLSLGVLPALFRPVITLTKAGFNSPLMGDVSWHYVDGMFLERIPLRDGVMHRLVFRITSLPNLVPSFGIFHRLLYALPGRSRKQQVHITLWNTSEPPEVVYRLARLLWRQAGRSAFWYPGMPEDVELALRQLHEAGARLGSKPAPGAPPPKQQEVIEALKNMQSASEVVSAEIRRQTRLRNRVTLGAVILLVVFLVSTFALRWLH